MSTEGSTEPPITGDKGTNGTHNQVLESEAGSVGPSGEAADVATRDLERHGDHGSSLLPINGAYVSPEGLRDESQYSPGLNTSSPAPESQEARDDPGSGGKQVPGPPSLVDEPSTASNEDKTRTAQDRTHRWQTQQLTGWAAVEKTLTDFDQQEVSGYKEDIDSLLTFAGLYSGVLTAFVIVSFTQLQEDTAAESLKVLRIIANQTVGNAVSNQPVTAATTLATTAPFQPSLTAKRVNVLWFASLIISLSTASLAILVKQWLRGYMAFASSSPQGQLRIRHFRRSGLETWRVFGIASMLPLLLQISLALFFVGLCFFTADIDPAIGNTALPLVCAWAFLFVIVTISSVFSARCPYKTPALSAITTTLRVHVWYNARRYAWVVFAISLMVLLLAFWRMLKLIRGTFGIWQDFVRAYKECAQDMMKKIKAIIDEPREEEVEYLNKATNDLAILVAADAAQANLELDLLIMEDALKQSNPKWDEVVHFLVQIIGNRIPLQSKFAKGPQTGLIDCRLLSTRTKAGIRGFLNHYVIDNSEFKLASSIQEIGDKPSWDSLSPFQQWTICVFLSLREADGHIPELLHPLSSSWFIPYALWDGASKWHIDTTFAVKVFDLLCIWINMGYTALPTSYNKLLAILRLYISNTQKQNIPDHSRIATRTTRALCSNAARKLGSDLFSYYWEHDTQGKSGDELCNIVIMLCIIAEDMGDVGPYEEVITPFVKEAFLRKSNVAVKAILKSLFGLNWYGVESWHRSRRISNSRFLLEIARSQDSEAPTSLINGLCLAVSEYRDSVSGFIAISTVAMQFLNMSGENALVHSPDRILWRRLFLLLARYWRVMRDSLDQSFGDPIRIWEEDELSDLVAIGEQVDAIVSTSTADSEESPEINAEQRRTSTIPDIFCLALGTLVEEEGKPPIWTAKHLRNISPQERMEIIAEGKVEMESAAQAVRELRERSAEDAQMGTPSAEDGSSEPHSTEAGPSGLPGAPLAAT